jgi:hypothetical protein
LAAVAVPNVGKFIGKGKSEAGETELHNIQTGVMAMLADDTDGVLNSVNGGTATNNMALITATTVDGDTSLDKYLTGLNGTLVKSTHTYAFTTSGTVTQN